MRFLGVLPVVLLLQAASISEGCQPPTPDDAPSARAPSEGPDAAFARFDVTDDGWLSGTELDACACAHYDADGDGEVTAAEFRAGHAPGAGTSPGPPMDQLESGGEGAAYPAGSAVEIEWRGGWYAGRVLQDDAPEEGGRRYLVRYDGYSETWDEWVGPDRLRPAPAADSPRPTQPEPATGPQIEPRTSPSAGSPAVGEGPPLGRYVCRQYMTTMGYLTLGPGGTYEVGGVTGRYRYDAGTGGLEWLGGSYAEWGWEGAYERVTRPPGDGRPDEDVVRLTSETDGLRINCYYMADQ
jgi:hypothetical protein